MAVSGNNILVSGQLPQTHGAPGVELLGGDAHFAAQAELTAIGEPGGGVDIDRGAVHTGGKGGNGGIVTLTMASLCPVEWAAMWATASLTFSTHFTARM